MLSFSKNTHFPMARSAVQDPGAETKTHAEDILCSLPVMLSFTPTAKPQVKTSA